MGLLSLFAIYYASITLFAHVHVINGVMLVHSHPFKKAHTHTEGQLLVLQTFSVFGSLEPETLELAHVSLPLLYSLDGHGLHSRYPLVWSRPSVCVPLPSLFLFDKSLFYRSFLMAGNDQMSYSD